MSASAAESGGSTELTSSDNGWFLLGVPAPLPGRSLRTNLARFLAPVHGATARRRRYANFSPVTDAVGHIRRCQRSTCVAAALPAPRRRGKINMRGSSPPRTVGMIAKRRFCVNCRIRAKTGAWKGFNPRDGRGSFHPLKRRRQWLDSASSMVGDASVNELSSATQWMERCDSMDGTSHFNGLTIARPSPAAEWRNRGGGRMIYDAFCAFAFRPQAVRR